MDAVGQAGLVRQGHASPRELVEAAIRRIEAVNPRINAVIEQRFEQALARAASKDLADGPFKGVPVLVKDAAIEGAPFHLGSRLLEKLDIRPPQSDELVLRTEAAGMIILGRTNVPELTSAPTTEPELHGAARNPWDTTRSTGGSSGGAGAAVASLMVPAAHASDGGGSTRIPASATGVVGLKASRGRVSAGPSTTDWMDITACKGWVTRSVRDTAHLLDVVTGPGRGDTLMAPASVRPFAAEVGAPTGRLRIGFMRHLPGRSVPLDAEAVAAVDNAARLLADLGHHVEEAHPAPLNTTEHFELISEYWPLKVAMRLAAAEAKLGRLIAEDEVEPGIFKLLTSARSRTLVDLAITLKRVHSYSLRMFDWYTSGFDLLLTPTTGCPAPSLGLLTKTGVTPEILLWAGFAPLVNLTGQPAISLPLHWTAAGLPLGVHLVGNAWREDLLIRVAAQLEDACPWRQRVPLVHG